jgi:hypothetical protein
MNWVVAASTGFGLGLAYFGGLWLSLRTFRAGVHSPTRFLIGRLGRLMLAAITFYALLRTGGIPAVALGLLGLLAARRFLVLTIGGTTDGR